MSGPWEEYADKPAAKAEASPWDEYAGDQPKVAAIKDLPKKSFAATVGQGMGNLGAGALRGAGSIGATLLWPIDKAQDLYYGDRGPSLSGLITGKALPTRNEERRQKMDDGLETAGAEPDSMMYKGGKLAGEIAGTAGAGGALGNGVLRAAPLLTRAGVSAPAVTAAAEALTTGGFRAGGLTGLRGAATRVGAGALSGGASGALTDPGNAGIGAGVGAVLPGVAKVGGKVGSWAANAMTDGAKRLMQSSLKPTIAQRKSGDAATAVEVMLENGINPTQGGVGKLRGLIDILNDQVTEKIANSTATVSRQKVMQSLDDVTKDFGVQVAPTADLAAIKATGQDFANHPGIVGDAIPVQMAQAMKQGTYRVLSKKFGQMGSADTEAQKALARGLKEGIAEGVPGIAGLNAAESKMIRGLDVIERRALMDLNKNPVGLAALAHSPTAWATMMADKSALFKSLTARMLNSTAQGAKASGARIEGIASLPMLRTTAQVASSRRE